MIHKLDSDLLNRGRYYATCRCGWQSRRGKKKIVEDYAKVHVCEPSESP